MSTATSRELIEQAIEATNRRALELVEEARQRRERDRQQRQQLATARTAGLGRRHADKLRHLARVDADQRDDRTASPANRVDTNTDAGVTETVTPVGQKSTTAGQSTTVAADNPSAANNRGPAGTAVRDSLSPSDETHAAELPSRYIPRAREDALKEARRGCE
ncbi:hypothetical protein OID55_11005 [Streptomyces sp. NBC_00715]|uniref:hypothetical protein n=1 Tax=Streptomyces sp. NBC_00715 TaxID=2975811 RepID=UPI003866FE17